jgi:hypothetical protein
MSAQELEDDRARRRDLTGIITGLLGGAGLGALTAALGRPGGLVIALVGALAGAIIGKAVAYRISADDWDPRFDRRPYVGTKSPDDDATPS